MADNEIVERGEDGAIVRVRFRTVRAHLTPLAMDELVGGYRDTLDGAVHDPLCVIPLVVLDFLCVHPFTDGNGRVSRLLTLLLVENVVAKVSVINRGSWGELRFSPRD